MIVCLCRGVSDHDLRAAIRAGHTLEDVMKATGAGSDCGCCIGALKRIAAAAKAEGVTIAANRTTDREAA